MKKEELIELGLTDEQAGKVLAMNGKDVEHAKSVKDKDITTLTTERDDLKRRLTTAENTLSGFDGKTPEQVREEIQSYKDQADKAASELQTKLTQRDQRDWLTQQLDTYGVKSPYARKQIISECMASEGGLTWREGAFLGFKDYMDKAKEADPSLYQTEDEKKAAEQEKKAPKIVGPTGDGDPGKSGDFVPPKIF